MKTQSSEVIRFSDITPEWVNREMHLHTNQTDGIPTIEQVIARAEEIGLGAIAFTEHVRSDSTWFPDFAARVRRAGENSNVRVLVGAEAAIVTYEGELNVSDEIRHHADILLASV